MILLKSPGCTKCAAAEKLLDRMADEEDLNITSYYYFVFIIFLLCFFTIFRIVQAPFGKTLVGIKESESRMRTLGYNVWLHKYICFVIASFFGGTGLLIVVSVGLDLVQKIDSHLVMRNYKGLLE